MRIFAIIIVLTSLIFVSVDGQGKKESALFPVICDKLREGGHGRMGYINLNGKISIPCSYYYAADFSTDGIAAVLEKQNGKWGFIDSNGLRRGEAKFDEVGFFFEGLAMVKVGGRWGYVSTSGSFAIIPKFSMSGNFKEGLAAVSLGGAWGFVDKSGIIVIPIAYERVYEFSEGLAGVVDKGKLGYIDKTGKWIIEARFIPLAHPQISWLAALFSEGLAIVRQGNLYGYIDKSGKQCCRHFLR